MSQKSKGSNFHPARVSGMQKQWRVMQENKRILKEQRRKARRKQVIPLDLSSGDWSIR